MNELRKAAILATALVHCGPTPETLVHKVERLLQDRDIAALSRHIDEAYGDPVGDRAVLLADLERLDRAYARWRIDWTPEGIRTKTTALVATVQTRLTAEFVGQPVWKVEGPMTLSLHRADQWRISGGLLSDVRDIRRLMAQRRAALEANDVVAMADTLHPHYRDGVVDKAEAIENLRRDLYATAIRLQATHYRLEVRPDLAHIDEHYIMTINGQPQPPAVAGLTLRRTAGRWRIAAGLYRRQE